MKNSIQAIKFIIPQIFRIDKSYFIVILLKVIIDSVIPFIMVLFPAKVIDEVQNSPFQVVLIYLLVFFIVSICIYMVSNFVNSIINQKNIIIDDEINKLINNKAMSLKLHQLADSDILNEMELAKQAANNVRLSEAILQVTGILSNVNILIGTLYIISFMGAFIIPVFITVLFVNVFFERKRAIQRQKFEKDNIQTFREGNYQMNIMNDNKCAKDIRVFDMQNFIINKYKTKLAQYENEYYKTRPIRLFYYFICFVCEGIRDFIIYVYVAIKFLRGFIDISEFYLYISAASQMYKSIKSLFDILIRTNVNMEYINRIQMFLNYNDLYYRKGIKEHDLKLNVKDDYVFQFCHVYFRYEGQTDYALEDIDFEIHKGSMIGIIGENGAGKTTLIKLLLRFYEPTKGEILLNGVNIFDYDYSEYIKIFSAMFQENLILPFTIEENVTLSTGAADKEKIDFLMEQTLLKEKVESFPSKHQTVISQRFAEDGIELSGGEQQKLMMTRGLFREADIYILDEPISALSPIAEFHIIENFYNLLNQKTCVFISHRMTFVQQCHLLLVLQRGRIVQRGIHQELKEKEGPYKTMYDIQTKGYI